ncbi:MAG: B12-binding domain-containing radical SAM protein [Candidatus Hydrothermarchaeales archaeon]
MVEIYLINPTQLEKTPALYPPLGIGYIVAVLKENGYSPKVLDLAFDPEIKQIKKIKGGGAVYGFTSTTTQFAFARDVAEIIKKKDHEGKIIFGGAHPTVVPEQVIADKNIDVAVLGEGEYTFLELVQRIESGKPIDDVKGIYYKENGRGINTGERPFIEDLDALPFPEQRDFDVEKYFELKGYRELSIISSRGCPGNCKFCQPTVRRIFGKKLRYRSAGNVVDEIENLIDRFRLDMLVISDDTFVSNRKRVEDICNKIIDRDIQILWRVQTRVGMKKETLKLMKKSGCFLVALGVESGSQEMLNRMGKGITIEKIKDTFKTCREVGILAHAFLIVGYPGETKETIQQTFDLIKDIKPLTTRVAIATPYPGTYLYDIAQEQNLISSNDILKYDHLFGMPTLNLENLSKEGVIAARDMLEDHTMKIERVKDLGRLFKDFIIFKKIIRMSIKDPTFPMRMMGLGLRGLQAKGPKAIAPHLNNK